MATDAEHFLRAFHRQMYVDLIRAYLRDYGSQKDLARALRLSEAYVSFLIEPLRQPDSARRISHWSWVFDSADYQIADAFKYAKTPSRSRARQMADELSTDSDRRDVLLHHVEFARPGRHLTGEPPTPMSADEVSEVLRLIGDQHQVALHSPDESANRAAYGQVWAQTRRLAESIDPLRMPVEYAQSLMFLHDAAQVANRPDLALGYARRAVSALSASRSGVRQRDAVVRLRINALLAEAVSLNTLGLRSDSMAVIGHAARLPGYHDEPESWLRSFLEQQLTALAADQRVSIYLAESIAEQAQSLVPGDTVLRAGINRRLLDLYITHASPRSRRKAASLSAKLGERASREGEMTPLRRAQVLNTLTRYYRSIGDSSQARELFAMCLKVVANAQLDHQRKQLFRNYRLPE